MFATHPEQAALQNQLEGSANPTPWPSKVTPPAESAVFFMKLRRVMSFWDGTDFVEGAGVIIVNCSLTLEFT
jgi:hypothetical protein